MSKGAYNNASAQDHLQGYYVDQSLSTVDRTVYVNKSTGKATVAFRGTDLKTKSNKWRDIGADIALTFGLQSKNSRFKNSLNATKAAVAKYGADNVTVTGHSLGGNEALYVSEKTGVKGTAFNAPVSTLDIIRSDYLKTYKHKTPYQNMTVDVMPGDPVGTSSLQLAGVQKTTHWHPLGSIVVDTVKELGKDYAEIKAASTLGPEAAGLAAEVTLSATAKKEGKALMGLHGMDNFLQSTDTTKPEEPTTPATTTTTTPATHGHRFTAQQLEKEYNPA